MANGSRVNLAWDHGNREVMGIDSRNSNTVQGIPIRTNPNLNNTKIFCNSHMFSLNFKLRRHFGVTSIVLK